MPRDFNTCSVRVRSPLAATLDSRIQVSISEDTPTCESATSAAMSLVRLVNSAVMPFSLR